MQNIFARNSQEFVKLHFAGDTITCTFEHPFFANNNWVVAGELKAGDSLFCYSGEKVKLDSVFSFNTDTATAVYNLEASGNHNYYVSASKVLVHNCNYTKSSLKLGQQMHKAYKAGFKGKEFRLPSGKRIDYLDIENGIIYELKPNNPRAIKQGYKQLEMYRKELQSMPQYKQIDWKIKLDTY